MNLKKLLMELGNYLVTERGYTPPVAPLLQLTQWLNATPFAQHWLGEHGVLWPTVETPNPTVEPQVVGFWVMDTQSPNDLPKWGEGGDTEFPFEHEEDALDQAAYLADTDPKSVLWIQKVLSNGQMLTTEYDPHERCSTCGTLLTSKMEENRVNRQDKSLTERRYCPKCKEYRDG